MSGMSSILCIPLYRDVASRHEPKMKRERPLGTLPSRKAVPLSFSSLREGSCPFWMDPQYAAHAAHAVDPSVLDVSSVLDAGPTLPP